MHHHAHGVHGRRSLAAAAKARSTRGDLRARQRGRSVDTIHNAKSDRFYKAPADTKSTTVGAAVQAAKKHIAAQGDRVATLQSHCHTFALAVYEGV